MSGHGIAEWFGEPFAAMSAGRRRALARPALGRDAAPPCPFQPGHPPCRKRGGVCSIQAEGGEPAIVCPRRFEQNNLLPVWLARVAGFERVYAAREVPFMRNPDTGKAAGRIDLIVAGDPGASKWYGLEVQAVYFSGRGMESEFEALLAHDGPVPPAPTEFRRPDWRSSSAKRLMPQLEVKAPTLGRWGTKLAVAIDWPFFAAIGGKSANPSQDLNDGDIIWLVPRMGDDFRLCEHHFEVLSLEASSRKLLAAETVKRQEFEDALRSRLERLQT
ncbi:MAG: hypothetical protein GKR94_20110 [Gammaproteobacteria bacterium]|nr:hypothetical protein [Gammaproteobacteria bacterium]